MRQLNLSGKAYNRSICTTQPRKEANQHHTLSYNSNFCPKSRSNKSDSDNCDYEKSDSGKSETDKSDYDKSNSDKYESDNFLFGQIMDFWNSVPIPKLP